MDSRELYSDLKTIPPIFVRLDGRSFHHLARSIDLKKPFDELFCDAMCRVSSWLIDRSGLNVAFTYSFSDEISAYVPFVPFNGRVEKIDSTFAAFCASTLTIALNIAEPIAFDARVIQVGGEATIAYLIQRQQEAWRNHVNAYCQQALIDEGMDSSAAAEVLKGTPSPVLHDMMFSRGINLAKTPAWQRRGILIYRSLEKKEGYNPVTQQLVTANRWVVQINQELPLFTTPEGRSLIESLANQT